MPLVVAVAVGAVLVAGGASAVADGYDAAGLVQALLPSCLGGPGGAEMDRCQGDVQTLAWWTGPDRQDRLAVCAAVHTLEETTLQYYPPRDIAALNRRLAAAALYAGRCNSLPGTDAGWWQVP